jgi:hypothetical protein
MGSHLEEKMVRRWRKQASDYFALYVTVAHCTPYTDLLGRYSSYEKYLFQLIELSFRLCRLFHRSGVPIVKESS